MFFLFRMVPLLVILPGAVYFFIHFKNLSFVSRFSRYKWIPWIISSFMTLICGYMVSDVFNFPAAIILFLFFSFIITDILNLIFKKLLKGHNGFKFWTWLYHSGIAAVSGVIIFCVIGYSTAMHVVVSKYDLTTNKNIGKPGIKIIMVSDIHLGTAVKVDNLQEYCTRIQAQDPDMVVLTGDIFDENTPKGTMEEACKKLGQIKSTYGTYYIFGNHEKGIHGNIPYFTTDAVAANLKANNITVLDDNTKLINNQFYIIGRKDAALTHTADRKSIPELLNGLDKSKFILLLDHQPLDFQLAAQNGVDLQLSGHTHGGQIWPTGLLMSIFTSGSLNYGYERIGNYQVIVSSGMGTWNYPMRLGSKSEIVQIMVRGQTP